MKVLFLGGVYPKNEIDNIRNLSRKGLDIASDSLQWSLISLLRKKVNVEVISVLPVKSYPTGFKKFFIAGSLFESNYKTKNQLIGFINLPIIKHFSIFFSLLNYLTKYLFVTNRTLILAYGLSTPKLLSLVILKLLNSKTHICVYVPDLPAYMSSNKGLLYRFGKLFDQIIMNWTLKYVDKFILISDNMRKELSINVPSLIIEGIYSGCFEQMDLHRDKCKKTIMYAGGIEKRYGLVNLIQAFAKINDSEFELWICGTGEDEYEIENMSLNDHRIKYFGFMPHHLVLEMQLKSTVLVNPRTPEWSFTKFSFPSKTIEYLASGTPVVMYMSQGIPEEYRSYCLVPEDNSVCKLAKILEDTCNLSKSELEIFGKNARNFILEKKSIEVQSSQILNFLFENQNHSEIC